MDAEPLIEQRAAVIITAGILALAAHNLARWTGFWQLSNTAPNRQHAGIRFWLPLLLAYFLYLGLQLIVIGIATLFKVSKELIPWFGVTATLISSLGVLAFSAILPGEVRQIVWGKSVKIRRNLLLGALCWVIAYPMVLFVGQIVSTVVWLIEPIPTPDQVAVRQIRDAGGSPFLLLTYVPIIVFLVPLVEEILFRGFLHSWMRTFLSYYPAAILTSIAFAICHFSISQGSANWELLTSLFVLSLYLCFLFEKQKTIWTSIGLHSFFNAISMIFIVFLDEK